MNIGVITAAMAVACGAIQAGELNWQWDTYEPRTPVLSGSVASGFHGAVAPWKRITKNEVNALTDDSRAWHGTAWRNERVNAQFVVWTRESAEQLRLKVTDLTSETGSKIPASACRTRFLRYVLSSSKGLDGSVLVPEALIGDCLDTAETVNLPENGFRPFWLTVDVPAKTDPGTYSGTVSAIAKGGRKIDFKVSLTVQDLSLPSPRDWKYHLDLWQHPWAVARYHGVKPFSPEHYALLRPVLGVLADAGQKTITTTLTDLPWNHQNFDPYYTMVRHVKQADGTWTHDYSLFDEWVTFAQSCGVGPQIHCYTMVTWGYLIHYVDGATGDVVAEKMVPGTSAHEKFWGPFLADFQKHVEAKGWLGRVYIAIDERTRADLLASADLLRRYAPGLKIQMAGNKPPSTFKGIEIASYAQSMQADWVSPAFKAEVSARRDKGYVTTTYICCSPFHPNTFTPSPYAEQQWLGLYTAAQGFDGLLRWAAFNWPRDPLFDSSYCAHHCPWSPGDTFLIYPGPRLSVRFENLRDSIENFEKIRILRETGRSTAALEQALSQIDYTSEAANGSEKYFADRVNAVLEAIDACGR